MRHCGQCGADISERPLNASYCADAACRKERALQAGRESWARVGAAYAAVRAQKYAEKKAARPPRPPRSCAFCGTDISAKDPRAKWCNLRCRDRARHGEREAHRWNAYAARTQRNAGLPVDPAIADADWRLIFVPGTRCVYCGGVAAEPDHKVPLSRGGRHDPSNIVPACVSCNRAKRNSMPDEWEDRLRHRRSSQE